MKQELIHTLTASFESYAHKTDGRVEFWLAREIQPLLGYDQWQHEIATAWSNLNTFAHAGID